jgi:hypothetical protein
VNSTLGPHGPPVGPTAQNVLAQRPGRLWMSTCFAYSC